MSAVTMLEAQGTSLHAAGGQRAGANGAQGSVVAARRGAGTVVLIDEARRRLRGDLGVGAEGDQVRPKATSEVLPLHSPLLAMALRVMAWGLAAVIAFSVAFGAGMVLRPAPYGGETFVHSVTSGESVWSLAESLGSTRALEEVVADIVSLNALDASVLHPGPELLLPTE